MEKLNSSILFTGIVCFSLALQSCKKENLICENGGIIINGQCAYPPFQEGGFCEIDTIQNRLTNESPLEIVSSGIPTDSLYGKQYGGGIIFYLDTEDTLMNIEGMVVMPFDISDILKWGCGSQDILDVPNVGPSDPEFAAGALIGDGAINTLAIVESGCAAGSAAEACANYNDGTYDDWFLPSKGELNLIYLNLGKKDCGNFAAEFYWSSTEDADYNAWGQHFSGGRQFSLNKASDFRSVLTRAVRAF